MLSVKLKTVRCSVTKSINKLLAFVQEEGMNETDVRLTVRELEGNRDRLVELHREQEKALEELLEAEPEDDNTEKKVEEEFIKMNEYIERIDSALAEADLALQRLKVEDEKGSNLGSNKSVHIRLPKIALPQFNGDVLKWTEFFECFEAAVTQADLTDVERFAYLKGQLRGEASNVISGLSLSSANYVIAIDLLKSRYGDKSVLIRAHIRQLLALDIIQNSQSDVLKQFLDKILTHTRSLESLGIARDNFDIFLSEIILSRISVKLKMIYSKLSTDNQTLSELIKIIETEVKGIELVKSTGPNNSKENSSDKFKDNTKINRAQQNNKHALSFVANNHIKSCSLCKQTHRLQDCEVMLRSDIDNRVKLIKDAKVCFNCLGPHRIASCLSQKRCMHCGGKHHSLIHRENTKDGENKPNLTSNVAVKLANNESVLPVVTLKLKANAGRFVDVGALLDTGSNKTFIAEDLCDKIDCRLISKQNLSIVGFSNSKVQRNFSEVECYFFDSELEKTSPINCLVLPDLEQKHSTVRRSFPVQLPNGKVPYISTEPIKMIVGCDNYYQIATGVSVPVKDNLHAIETKAGWTLQGVLPSVTNNQCNFISVPPGKISDLSIEQFWKVELIDSDKEPEKIDYYSWFKENVSFSDGRYTVKFPWRPDKILWSTYEESAKMRLGGVVRSLLQKGKLEAYDQIIRGYLKDGIAEMIPESDSDNRIRVLPHHPVFKDDSKTTKMRIVLDASAKKGPDDNSLNDCMAEGQNFLSNLMGILLRFRYGEYAFTADIEKAFLQLNLHPDDRDAVRFFWFSDAKKASCFPLKPDLFRMKRLPFGIKASPFLLCASIQHHLDVHGDTSPETVGKLRESLYMDDLIYATDDLKAAHNISQSAKSLFQDMSMNLRKWCSNFPLNVSDTVENESGKVFGIPWHIKTDSLVFSVDKSATISTKRELASYLCSVWDPFGYLAPFVLHFKLLLQKAWRDKIEWDQELPIEIAEAIKSQLGFDRSFISVPRCLIKNGQCELFCVCDSSERAYSACVYVGVRDGAGNLNSSQLLISKVRLAPVRKITIPKLELLGALLLAKLVHLVRNQIHLDFKTHFFCDSQTVLHWIQNKEKQWVPFVQRRVQTIRELVPDQNWSYIPSKENPADIASRGCSLPCLQSNKLWWQGPNWEYIDVPSPTTLADVMGTESACNTAINQSTYENILPLNRYSTWSKAIKVVMYVKKFIRACRKQTLLPDVSPSEVEEAEKTIFRLVQHEKYPQEIETLLAGNSVDKSSPIYQLNPFFDKSDRLLKVNTRLQNSNLPTAEVYPIIIPKTKPLDRLLVRKFHVQMMHSSVSSVLCEMRKELWLPRGRQRIKSVLRDCNLCKRRLVTNQKERYAPLPLERVDTENVRPFLNTGVDFFGPLSSQNGKVYGLIFTCLQVRAVHIELTESLQTQEFLSAFDRFVARRSLPQSIFSDNALTFKAAAKILTIKHKLKWNFIVELAPSKGGAWERLIQNIKKPLRLLLRNKRLSYNEINTLLCKIELIVNLRPLSYISEDPNDLRPITPNDFLVPKMSSDKTQLNESLSKQLMEKDKILNIYIDRWKKEYLKERVVTGVEEGQGRLKVGDVVMVDDGKPKEFWPLGRVLSLNRGRDGIVRSLFVLCKGKTIRRGINRVYFFQRPGENVES